MKDFPEHPVVGMKVLIDETMKVYEWDGEVWREDWNLSRIVADLIDYFWREIGKMKIGR